MFFIWQNQGGVIMGTILESLHKIKIHNEVDRLTSEGGKPFTTLSHCPLCNVEQQGFEKVK